MYIYTCCGQWWLRRNKWFLGFNRRNHEGHITAWISFARHQDKVFQKTSNGLVLDWGLEHPLICQGNLNGNKPSEVSGDSQVFRLQGRRRFIWWVFVPKVHNLDFLSFRFFLGGWPPIWTSVPKAFLFGFLAPEASRPSFITLQRHHQHLIDPGRILTYFYPTCSASCTSCWRLPCIHHGCGWVEDGTEKNREKNR